MVREAHVRPAPAAAERAKPFAVAPGWVATLVSLYWAIVGGVIGYAIGMAIALLLFHITLKRYEL